MKVLVVIMNPGYGGGAERAAFELSRALHAKGVAISIAAMSLRVEGEPDGLPIRIFPSRTYPFQTISKFFVGTSIPKEIDFSSFDLVHIHNVQPPRALVMVAKACLRAGVPYAITTHGFVETATRSGRKLSLPVSMLVRFLIDRRIAFALSHAAMVASLTRFETPYLLKYGVEPSRIRVISNGARPDLLARRFKKVDVRSRWNLGSDTFVLFVGNLKSNKGVDVLLKAAGKIQGRIVIVGGGVSVSYEEELRKIAHDDRKVIFTGKVDDDTLCSLYEECAVFTLPTRGDTLPLVILDAMALKKPVVATRVGGIPEEVDETNGILIEPDDSVALATALNVFLGDFERRLRSGQAGYQKIIEKFTWQAVADRVLTVYNEILQDRSTESFS